MENGTSFFEDKINALDTTLVELRNGSWGAELTKANMKKEYYKRYKYIISEFKITLESKLLKEEAEQLYKLENELNGIKDKKKEDYIIEDDFGNELSSAWVTNINYDKGIFILKKMERLLRNIVERLVTRTRTH